MAEDASVFLYPYLKLYTFLNLKAIGIFCPASTPCIIRPFFIDSVFSRLHSPPIKTAIRHPENFPATKYHATLGGIAPIFVSDFRLRRYPAAASNRFPLITYYDVLVHKPPFLLTSAKKAMKSYISFPLPALSYNRVQPPIDEPQYIPKPIFPDLMKTLFMLPARRLSTKRESLPCR